MALTILLLQAGLPLAIVVALCLHVVRSLSYPTASGPPAARWSGCWYLSQVWKGHFEKWNIAAHALGETKIVRIAPRMYSIDDPAAVNVLYTISAPMKKSSWYAAWSDPRVPDHNMFSALNQAFHAGIRRKVGSLFSLSAIKSYEPAVDDCIGVLLHQLDGHVAAGRPVDLQHWMQCYAFDVIGAITFGSRVGFVESGGKDIRGIMKALQDSVGFSSIAGLCPLLTPLLLAVYGNPVKGIRAFSEVQKSKSDLQHLNGEKQTRATFWDKLREIREQDPTGYKTYHLDAICEGNVAAGSDTTSISLTSALYYITTTPGVLDKLRDEIERESLSDPVQPPITFDQAQKLPYLMNTIKEALRIHPATGLPLWREVVGEGVTVAGTHFPAGAILGVNSWVAHRNASVFGNDTEAFRPERWDPAVTPPEQLAAMEKYYLPFGAGTRTCICKHISHLEMLKLLPELVRRYDFDCVDTTMECQNMWFVKPDRFRCRLKRRTRRVET